ncbi:hypothetical protein WDV93_14175 [Pantoea ananatis]
MPRIFRRRLAAVLALILLLLGLLLTITQWLPRLVGIWLPAGTRRTGGRATLAERAGAVSQHPLPGG